MRVLFCEFGVELWFMGLNLDLVAEIILRVVGLKKEG
jgi:hypothetical protein